MQMSKKEHFNLMYFICPCTCLREIIFLQKFSQAQPSKTVLNYFHFQGPRLEFQTQDCQDLVFGIKQHHPLEDSEVLPTPNRNELGKRNRCSSTSLYVLRPLMQFGNKTKTKQNKETIIIIPLVSMMYRFTDGHVCPKESKLG